MAETVGRIVAEQGSEGRRDDDEHDAEVVAGGQHRGGDDHGLAWQHGENGVASADRGEQHIGPRRSGDGVRDRVEHLLRLPVEPARITIIASISPAWPAWAAEL